jgi:hypothetical protein
VGTSSPSDIRRRPHRTIEHPAASQLVKPKKSFKGSLKKMGFGLLVNAARGCYRRGPMGRSWHPAKRWLV